MSTIPEEVETIPPRMATPPTPHYCVMRLSAQGFPQRLYFPQPFESSWLDKGLNEEDAKNLFEAYLTLMPPQPRQWDDSSTH